MAPRLSIIIVSHNTRELLSECLTSVDREGDSVTSEVVVVDNASSDGTMNLLPARFPRVRFLDAGGNIGFAAANNLGLATANGSMVLFLNPDTILLPGALASAVSRLASDPTIGVLGCRILHPDGRVQPSARALPTLLNLFVESFGLHKLLPYGPPWGDPWITDDLSEQPVGVVKGAFLLTRRDVLAAVGNFDERFFLYSEEQDWCRRVTEAGLKVWYYPGAAIVHREGSSSPVRRNSARFIIYDSETEYFRKHHGATVAGVARCLMAVGVMLRALVWTLLSGLGLHSRGRLRARYYLLALLWFIERSIGLVPRTTR